MKIASAAIAAFTAASISVLMGCSHPNTHSRVSRAPAQTTYSDDLCLQNANDFRELILRWSEFLDQTQFEMQLQHRNISYAIHEMWKDAGDDNNSRHCSVGRRNLGQLDIGIPLNVGHWKACRKYYEPKLEFVEPILMGARRVFYQPFVEGNRLYLELARFRQRMDWGQDSLCSEKTRKLQRKVSYTAVMLEMAVHEFSKFPSYCVSHAYLGQKICTQDFADHLSEPLNLAKRFLAAKKSGDRNEGLRVIGEARVYSDILLHDLIEDRIFGLNGPLLSPSGLASSIDGVKAALKQLQEQLAQ